MPEKPSIIQSEDVILKAEDRDDADPTYLPQNVLLTGGCGFIGSHVCKYLVGCESRKNRLDLSGQAIDQHCSAFQVKKYPQYNFINLDILDTCATTKNLSEIEDCKNYTFVQGSIANMDLVRVYLILNNIATQCYFQFMRHAQDRICFGPV